MTTSRRTGKAVTQPAGEPGTSALPAGAHPAAPEDAQELEREITQTREQLGETVAELIAKSDVKSRLQAAAAQTAAKGASVARQRRVPLAAASGLLILGYLVIRRWRSVR
jgi:hypothetical protein